MVLEPNIQIVLEIEEDSRDWKETGISKDLVMLCLLMYIWVYAWAEFG